MITFASKTNRNKEVMTEFKDLVRLRRSHRKFTEETISEEDMKCILRAALMSPTSVSRSAISKSSGTHLRPA